MSNPTINLKDPKYSSITHLKVVNFVGKGKRANVFKVIDSENKIYALKTARDDDTEERLAQAVLSLAKESSKAQIYSELGISYSSVLQSDVYFVIKEWVEGIRADEWVHRWTLNEMPCGIEIDALRRLIHLLAIGGTYLGDLNAKNLIWSPDKTDWVVVDSGNIRPLPFGDAVARYVTNISNRWGKYGTEKTVERLKILLESSLIPTESG